MSGRQLPPTTDTLAEATRAGLALIAIVLLARGNAGALTRTPPAWVGLMSSLLVWSLAATAARWVKPSGTGPVACWRDCLAPALITLIVGGRGSSSQLGVAIGLVTIGILGVALAVVWRQRNFDEQVLSCQRSPQAHFVSGTALPDRSLAAEPAASAAPLTNPTSPDVSAETAVSSLLAQRASVVEDLPGEIVEEEAPAAESWTRRESEGEVSIEAVILARFEEGSKLAIVHLPFMPPLPAVPQIECEPLDSGCEVMIKAEAAYRHGARLSVTRRAAGPAESVPIGVVVYTSAEEPVES